MKPLVWKVAYLSDAEVFALIDQVFSGREEEIAKFWETVLVSGVSLPISCNVDHAHNRNKVCARYGHDKRWRIYIFKEAGIDFGYPEHVKIFESFEFACSEDKYW